MRSLIPISVRILRRFLAGLILISMWNSESHAKPRRHRHTWYHGCSTGFYCTNGLSRYQVLDFAVIAVVVLLFDSTAFLCVKLIADDHAGAKTEQSIERGELLNKATEWIQLSFLTFLERSFKTVIQLIIGQIIIFRFYPYWNDVTSVCEEQLPGSERTMQIITSTAMWVLLPVRLHMLLHTFVYGQQAPRNISRYMNLRTLRDTMSSMADQVMAAGCCCFERSMSSFLEASLDDENEIELDPLGCYACGAAVACKSATECLYSSRGVSDVEATEIELVEQGGECEQGEDFTQSNPMHTHGHLTRQDSTPDSNADTTQTREYVAMTRTGIFLHRPEFWHKFNPGDPEGFVHFFLTSQVNSKVKSRGQSLYPVSTLP